MVVSFGYRPAVYEGLSVILDCLAEHQDRMGADLVVDVRDALGDREAATEGGTARRPEVRRRVLRQHNAEGLVEAACADLRKHRRLCVGCEGGNHRAPSVGMESSKRLRAEGFDVEEIHLGLLVSEEHWAGQDDRDFALRQVANRMWIASAQGAREREVSPPQMAAIVRRIGRTYPHHRHDHHYRGGGSAGPYRAQKEEAYLAYFASKNRTPTYRWRDVCHQHWRNECEHSGTGVWRCHKGIHVNRN